MKCTICPECREIIADDELRGTSTTCHACACRTDRSDLIEIETEKPSITENTIVDEDVRHQMTPLPVIHSLDELMLMPYAHWEDESSSIGDMAYRRTLVLNQPKAIGMLLLGLFLTAIGLYCFVATFGDIIVSMAGLLFFGVGGGWLIYSSIKTFPKVWIRIFQDRLEICRGFRKNEKYKVFTRYYHGTSVSAYNYDVKAPSYRVYISQDDESYTLACELSSSDSDYGYITECKRIIYTILKAEL